jgi:hypothetical protein
MTITAEDLNVPAVPEQPTNAPAQTPATEPEPDPQVRIVAWTTEVPRNRRASPFDPVIDEIRKIGDTDKVAQIDWGPKEITANKVNQLRKRYTDCEFTQVTDQGQRVTFVRLKAPEESA